MNEAKKVYKSIYNAFTMVAGTYITLKATDKKARQLAEEDSVAGAFLIGAGQMALSMAVGFGASSIIAKGLEGKL
jgi:hypothetical protein